MNKDRERPHQEDIGITLGAAGIGVSIVTGQVIESYRHQLPGAWLTRENENVAYQVYNTKEYNPLGLASSLKDLGYLPQENLATCATSLVYQAKYEPSNILPKTCELKGISNPTFINLNKKDTDTLNSTQLGFDIFAAVSLGVLLLSGLRKIRIPNKNNSRAVFVPTNIQTDNQHEEVVYDSGNNQISSPDDENKKQQPSQIEEYERARTKLPIVPFIYKPPTVPFDPTEPYKPHLN